MRNNSASQSLRNLGRTANRSSILSSSSSTSTSGHPITSSTLLLQPSNTRSLFGFSFGKSKASTKPLPFNSGLSFRKPLISQDDLFHPLSKSPIPAMVARGERVKRLAPCPISMARDGIRRNVQYLAKRKAKP